ncbi:MAG: ABC transporter ATP-binding protein [Chloroflexi bacterium]|nr:ABC transporter ATP-binding protein [Chloroflexota bacterium]
MIDLRNVSFAYPGHPPLFAGLSWRAPAGASWSLIGPSGCGKSTLLYLLAGLRRPTGGEVQIAGAPLRGVRRATGLILQDGGLLPWATAAENIALGLKLRQVSAAETRRMTDAWLARLGLSHVAGQYPAELSGGQRQRVAIGRTLALDPDLLLMDEPFAALDTLTREDLQDLVIALGDGAARTTVIVTHNIDEAVFLSQRVLVLAQAPTREPFIIANPGAGAPGYRQTAAFRDKCGEVRAAIQGTPERAPELRHA